MTDIIYEQVQALKAAKGIPVHGAPCTHTAESFEEYVRIAFFKASEFNLNKGHWVYAFKPGANLTAGSKCNIAKKVMKELNEGQKRKMHFHDNYVGAYIVAIVDFYEGEY